MPRKTESRFDTMQASSRFTEDEWNGRLADIRMFRVSLIDVERALDNAEELLSRAGWTDPHLRAAVGLAWHPAGAMVERLRRQSPKFGVALDEGNGLAYLELERHAGKLPKQGKLASRSVNCWYEGPEARGRFVAISAALIYFESGMVKRAIDRKDEAGRWCAAYWITRFDSNIREAKRLVAIELSKRSKTGRERDATKEETVHKAFARLGVEQQGSSATALIARRTGYSLPTVRKYLPNTPKKQE